MATELQNVETTVATDAKKVLTFGLSHLVLICMLAGATCFGFYEYDNRRAQAADAKAAIAVAEGKQADADNIKYQASTAAQIIALQQANAELSTQYASIMNAMAARDAALAKQQQVIAAMPPTELAETWEQAIKIPNSVTPSPNGTYSVTQPAAVATVQALNSVATLTKDKADLQTSNELLNTKLDHDDAAFALEVSSHTADNTTCTADKKALNDTISKNKSDYKKSRWHWLAAGAGIVATLFLIK